MNMAVVLLLILGMAFLVSIPALFQARRSGCLSLADVMLPVAPAVMLVVGLQLFNQPAHVGYALVFYPPAVAFLSVVLLYAKVFVFGTSKAVSAGLSTWTLIVSCALGVVLGATAMPWYE